MYVRLKNKKKYLSSILTEFSKARQIIERLDMMEVVGVIKEKRFTVVKLPDFGSYYITSTELEVVGLKRNESYMTKVRQILESL